MFLLVTGGSASGKSAYAEQRAVECGGKRYYIATMQPFGIEGEKRILKHRALRRGKEFHTLECYTRLNALQVETESTILLECMSNLLANEIYLEEGFGNDWRKKNPDASSEQEETAIENAVMEQVGDLLAACKNLIVVTNEVFSDGISYDKSTEAYIRILGRLNRRMGALADEAVEVVYSIPIVVKSPGDRLGGRK